MDKIISSLVIPIVVALVVGAGSSYISAKLTLERMGLKVEYVERDVASLKSILEIVNSNQRELAVRSIYIANTNKELTNLWIENNRLEERIIKLERGG